MSSMDPLQYAGFLPLKLVFSALLFGDEPGSHFTSTLHRLQWRDAARLISILASGRLGYCACSQLLACSIEELHSLPKVSRYSAWLIVGN